MAISVAEEAKLGSAQQRMACRFVTFEAFTISSLTSFTDGTYTFKDLVNIYPRHSWADNSATIVLDGTASIQRGGAASTGWTWALTGSGTITDNLNGTCDYTAPASGSGVAKVKLTTDGNTVDNYARISYGNTMLNIGEVTAFHADIGTGGWEMTVRAYGDCTGLERQCGVLLCVTDYWNGSADTFGGVITPGGSYRYSPGVFYGYVNRIKRIHDSADLAYMEVTLQSPSILLNYGYTCDLLFVKVDTADNNIVIATLEPIDAIWYILFQTGYNQRHNCYISDDTHTIANLKISAGPLFDVIRGIATRTFYVGYDTKLGDLMIVGDPDIRYGDYFTNLDIEFEIDADNYEYVDLEFELISNRGDPPDIPDPTFWHAELTAVQSDLEELFSRYPSGTRLGKVASVNGLICETQATLANWANNYWFKLQPHVRFTARMFLMHHVDLYSQVHLIVDVPNTDLSNTEYEYDAIDAHCYVTGIDYDIDPGMGTWRGSVEGVSLENVV